jgi:Flp pilus assembly CpaE family ATPase
MKGSMLAFVVTSDRAHPQVARLEQLLVKYGYVIVSKVAIDGLVDDPQLQAHGHSLVLVPSIGNQGVTAEAIIRLAGRLMGHAFVVYVSDEIPQSQYKALVRTGAGDCVGWESAIREIVEISQRVGSKVLEAEQPSETPESQHVVVSFLGTGGGNGNTTLALESAASLVSARGKNARRVAIVDLNFQRSVMADYLDLVPQLDIVEVMRNPQRLDRYLLDIFTSKHGSTLDIFASDIDNIDFCAIDGSVVCSLLEHITDVYDIVFLDLPPCWAPWIDGVLKNSDLVFVTGLYTVPSVKQIMHELERLSALDVGPEHLAIVINQCRTNTFGWILRDANIDGVLTDRRVFRVRQDWPFALECVNTGVSMVQTKPRREICRDIKKIGDAVMAVKPKVAP